MYNLGGGGKTEIVNVITSDTFNSLVHQTTPLSVQEACLLIIDRLTLHVQNCCSVITTQQFITSTDIHFTAKMTGKI